MDCETLQEIVKQHKLWFTSKGEKGKRADFTGADLKEANLRGTSLIGAKLPRADFERADLEEADLREALVEDANFKYTNLRGANLKGLDMQGVDLQGADLFRANLKNTQLKYTNLKFIKIDRMAMIQIDPDIVKAFGNTWFVLDFGHLIIRSVELPPEFHQSGISLLTYFGTILRNRFPSSRAKIRIEQCDTVVTMSIDPLEEDREKIEDLLDEYGCVITGKKSPKAFISNKALMMDLRHEIRYAVVRIEHQKELSQYHQNSGSNREIKIEDFFKVMEKVFQKSNSPCGQNDTVS